MTTGTDPHQDYLAQCQNEVARARLLQILQQVDHQVPGAMPCMGYGMPAFRQARIFFYVGAFKQHIGIYPPLTADAALVAETAAFRGPKGNLSFSLRKELPLALIGRVAAALALQYALPRTP